MADFIFKMDHENDHATATDGNGRQVWEGTIEAAKIAIEFANSGGKKVSVCSCSYRAGRDIQTIRFHA